ARTAGRAIAWFRPRSRAPCVLSVHGGDIEGLRILRAMRMIRTGIDPQIAELDASERPAWQHAFHRLLDHALGEFSFQDRARGPLLDAADEAGVVAVDLLLALAAGEHDLGRVDDDDVVAIVDVRGIGRLVLAAQPHRDNAREPADDQAGGVDHHPLLLDVGGL